MKINTINTRVVRFIPLDSHTYMIRTSVEASKEIEDFAKVSKICCNFYQLDWMKFTVQSNSLELDDAKMIARYLMLSGFKFGGENDIAWANKFTA